MKLKLIYDQRLASLSWCQAPFGTDDQILISLSDNYFLSSFMYGTLPDERLSL
jgi:hypothetical protein